MFQCLPLLEGRVHISERDFLLSGWVTKNWFLKCGWLSIFVEFMWVILYLAANQQNTASQGGSSSSKTCRVCLTAVTFQESWFVVGTENIWQLIPFFRGTPFFVFFFWDIGVLITHCLSPNQSIFGHFPVIQSGLSGWMNRFWKPRRRCFFSRGGWGRCSTSCGGVESLMVFFCFLLASFSAL